MDYHGRLKAELPQEVYRNILALLKAYRKSKDSNALIDGVVDILRPKDRRHLLADFIIFVDKPEREWCARCIKCVLYWPCLSLLFCTNCG